MKDEKRLEGYYGYILAKCNNNFDAAQDVCVYILENKLEVSEKVIDQTIQMIDTFKKNLKERNIHKPQVTISPDQVHRCLCDAERIRREYSYEKAKEKLNNEELTYGTTLSILCDDDLDTILRYIDILKENLP